MFLAKNLKNIHVPICIPANVGSNMCIDEKQIGEDIYTVMINQDTGEIAFMADAIMSAELFEAVQPIRDELRKVKVIKASFQFEVL